MVAFGAGTVLLNWLADQAARAGVHLIADFRRTDRNRMMEVAYRFAGFADAAVTAGAPSPAARRPAGVQRLHLVPARRRLPGTVRVDAPDLAAGASDRPDRPWQVVAGSLPGGSGPT